MKELQVSPVFTPHVAGNVEFSAKKIRADKFTTLMDPIIGFDDFQLTKDVFGPHPHAGMTAISYVFEDSASYMSIDSRGKEVLIGPGSMLLNWAGKGLVHAEYPVPENARVKGLQLFINIPAEKKQSDPQGIFVQSNEMPELKQDGLRVRVVIGFTGSLANQTIVPELLTILHIYLQEGKMFTHTLPSGWNATLYNLNGRATIQSASQNIKLGGGTVIAVGESDVDEDIIISSDQQSELILISGIPTKQKLFAHGSLAMSSESELLKTLDDYQRGRMGFVQVVGKSMKVVLPV